MKKRILFIYIFLAAAFIPAKAQQDTIKIMYWNLLNYQGANAKDQYYRKVVGYVQPDILTVGEITSQGAVNDFLGNCVNYYAPGTYSAATFIDGPDTDNALFFKSSKFTYLAHFVIPTTLRNIDLFLLRHNGSGDTVTVFAVHLKASSGTTNENQRLTEVNALRNFTNAFPSGTEFMVMGDFNIYGSTEPAYQKLVQVQSGNEGHFVDPYGSILVGAWQSFQYRAYHTQSTRTASLPDGGSTGGMDDRFDMILNSQGLMQPGKLQYVNNSLVPIGNDGNHYNIAINNGTNTAAPDSIITALYFASDHLPVMAKYTTLSTGIKNISTVIPDEFSLSQNYPNPFNPVTNIRFAVPNAGLVKLTVYDMLGKEVATLVNEELQAGEYSADFNAANLTSGVYFYKLESGSYANVKKMMLIK